MRENVHNSLKGLVVIVAVAAGRIGHGLAEWLRGGRHDVRRKQYLSEPCPSQVSLV